MDETVPGARLDVQRPRALCIAAKVNEGRIRTHDTGPMCQRRRTRGGCTSKDGNRRSRRNRETAAAHLDKAKAETKEAAQAMREYAYVEKAEFVAKMKRTRQHPGGVGSASGPRSTGLAARQRPRQVKLEAVREKWLRRRALTGRDRTEPTGMT